MSKEQTPITAEEKLLIIEHNLYKEVRGKCISDSSAVVVTVIAMNFLKEFSKQYANQKVLEALEREVKVAFETGYNNALNNCEYFDGADVPSLTSDEEEYYETEVKPRYK